MKWHLLLSILMLSLASNGQTDTTTIYKPMLNADSLVEKTKRLNDSISNSISIIKSGDDYSDIDRNMRYIQEIQKKNEAKKKKSAMMRMLIGAGFLVILIIGLRRKRKRKVD